MSEKVRFIIPQRVDLMTVNTPMVYAQALEYHNHAAHEWQVHVVANSRPIDLTGCTVACYAARSDKKTVYIKGSASGSVASVVFDSAFYAINGEIAARMELTGGDGQVMAVARLCCMVSQTGTDTIIDPSGEIPTLDNLMALIEAMKTATQEAEDAAQRAQDVADEVAGRAPYIGANGHWYVWDKETEGYADSGVTATGPQGAAGEAGTNGQTPYIGENGNWWIGSTDTGTKAQGPAGANGTGSGTVTAVKIGETTYSPDDSGVVDMGDLETGPSLPTGGTAGQTLVKQSVTDGDAAWKTLTAADVGALSSDPRESEETEPEIAAVPINADQLGGKSLAEIMLLLYPVGAIYTSTVETSPASLFGGTWEQLQDRFLLGAGDSYAAGSTGGEATHTLTVDEMAGHEHAVYMLNEGNATVYWGPNDVTQQGGINFNQTGRAGGDQPHNNMPPYLAVYMWKRVS